ncbi:class I SAM-dependent methyltransferase [Rheinheimera texasensis]|uniref:class I SAM-dependent methyltransferase n=1 Tax=Rheinheimera texasensis TaxID=306205 RepID=UPI0004E0DCAA|nr:class I SAM-dependent methyltransferase [Rheinheimera texasensis]
MKQTQSDYLTDVPYSYSFYKEMTPGWLSTAAMFQGVAAPDPTLSFRYCDLGCGFGINLLVAALAYPQSEFIGVDLNPEHTAAAQAMADAADLSNVRFITGRFADVPLLSLGTFDYVVCHGVWSWVSQQVRLELQTAFDHLLSERGLGYLHYMCHPGSTRMQPIQKLIHEIAKNGIGGRYPLNNVQLAIKLLAATAQAGAFHDSPDFELHIKAMTKHPENYLAHEFLTEYWLPEHSVDVHERLATENIRYLGSGVLTDNIDSISIPANLQPVLQQIGQHTVRELFRDLVRNQRQRVDIFQRSAAQLNKAQQLRQLNTLTFAKVPGAVMPQRLATSIGMIDCPAPLVEPLWTKLQLQPLSYAECCAIPVYRQNVATLQQLLQLMMCNGIIHPINQVCQADHITRLNKLSQQFTQWRIALMVLPELGTAIISGQNLSL